MKPSPCLNPVRVFNDSLGAYVTVPCGHCDACLLSKGFKRTQNVNDMFLEYHYKYLVTLTYDDAHLPLAKLSDGLLIHDRDVDYNGVFHNVQLSDLPASNLSFVDTCINKFGGVPVVSHRDIINFKKRLRYYVNDKAFGKANRFAKVELFVFCASEYGPTTFRPHYHLLLGCNDRRIANVLEVSVSAAWQSVALSASDCTKSANGYIDFQVCVGGDAAGYCARYLNCSTHLPYVLSRTVFRPFAQMSRRTTRFVDRNHVPTLSNFVRDLPTQIAVKSVKDGTTNYCSVPEFVENRYLPKLPKFGQISSDGCHLLYAITTRYSFNSCEEFVSFMLDCFSSPKTFDVVVSACKRLYYDASHLHTTKFSLAKLYYVSRRVVRNAVSLGLTVYQFVKFIYAYYSRKALAKLKSFYELQQSLLDDFYHPVSLQALFTLYYDTDEQNVDVWYYYTQFGIGPGNEPVSVFDIPQEVSYMSLVHKIMLDTSKTKKRNDEFNQRGWKRPIYVPFLSRNKSKFLTF